MPNLANAKKALRQSVKHAERNKLIKDELASLRRHFKVAIKDKKIEDAKKIAMTIQQKIDKAVKGNIFKPNTAGRVKSRMAAAMKRMTSSK